MNISDAKEQGANEEIDEQLEYERQRDNPKLNEEQIENLTYSLYSNLMDFKQLNTGFTPSREDIIKCLDYALKDL